MRHIKEFSQLFENTQELAQEQKDWLDACTAGRWKLNPQTGLVDVDRNFNCQNQDLPDFEGVRFGDVGGNFDCSDNSLTSLEGAPQSVGGDFWCYDNSLTSLKGAPQSVGGYFACSENSLTSLEGAPQIVGGSFGCQGNQLTSLEGAPRRIGRDFDCYYNQLTSLEGAPQEVGGNLNCSGNPISNDAIVKVIKLMSRKKITLEQAVSQCWNKLKEEDMIHLVKHNPDLSPEEKRGYEALGRLKKRVI